MEFQTIRHPIDDGGISLPRVTSRVLAIVIELCRKYMEASKREENVAGDDDPKTWEELFDLIRFVSDGSEDSTLSLQACLDKVTGGDILNLQLRLDLLSAFFKYILGRPNFCTIFCQALQSTPMSDGFLEYVSNTLNLSLAEKIGVGLALFESDSVDLRMRGQNFCISLIEDLIANPTTPAVSHEQIQDIILFLYRSGGLSKHVDYFTKLLSLVPPSGSFVLTQSPILTDDESDSLRQLDLFYEGSDDDFESVLAEIEKEMSMAEIVKEIGYGCTVSTSHCKEILSFFLPLHESTLAKLLGKIACTHIGLDDTQSTYLSFCSALGSNSTFESSLPSSWNIDVLINSIKQIAPETNWTHVMENLDHEGFNIPDKASFSLLMSIYSKACGDPFPLHAICGSAWKNAEGQISFLKHAVVASPDVFTFAHCSRQLANTGITHLPKGSGNHAWSCLDLLDVLCQLAERGYINSIRSMLDPPLKDYPEVLLVGISHVKTAYNLLQYEVLSTVFPVILNDSTKTSVIHHLWEVNANLVLRGFIDTHTDPNSLLRILDICQEMKILSSILDASPFIVSFRLASCAYRKELTNLEKWLNENLTLFKDAFFEGCIAFLKEILSDVKNDVSENIQQSRLSLLNAYQETFPTFFKVLQTYSGQLTSRELFDEFKRLHDLSNSKFQRPTAADLSTSDGSPDDIEAEANTYFHQMFSGLLTIDAMVQMLARFKESSEKREQLIFECMIANLFEEYKFFPKYPDRQLKLAAILFGSLIKNQLVTHLTLGIALRGVLDALRKSVDSKMFMFGTKALEQFIDRLVEWPQYCNHILQISHLRTSHAELVSVIERALARISSSQAESNGGNNLLADQQQGCLQVSVENMEASEASWQFMGSNSSSQLGQQLSPFQPQQKHQGFLGDRLKQHTLSISNINLISSAAQSSLVSTPVDSVINPKPNSQSLQTPSSQHSTGVPATVSSSPGFLRSSRSITSAGMLRQPSYSTSFGAALNIETLVAAAERRDTPIEAPASEVQDKILFMINNLSTANVEAKAKEFAEVINEQYYPWFAQYMVMKRASIEPNFHDLYLKFLDKVNSKELTKEIVKATYENCKVLLRSDLIKSSSEERSLLKNLGSWLGKFTIGRNQTLRAKEIDPKALIIEAYEKGLMIAVIPFTSKVLEPCQSSLAYKPPNPWTMGILGLLVEIYNLPNLKMNLKFDIEVLFKNLGVDMKEVKPTSLLKDRVREVEGNPDFSSKDISVSQAPVIAEVSSAVIPPMNQVELQADVNNLSRPTSHPNVLAQYASPLHHGSNTIAEDEKVGPLIILDRVPSAQGLTQVTQSPSSFSLSQLLTMTPVYESHININPKLSQMSSLLQIHRFTKAALDKAIKDIVLPVIQRSVTIASRTTKELVLKDYAMESDDGAISRAAHLMVGTLAGSLAHVTCKEPLRVALSNHLRNLLQTLNLNGDITDQMVQIITNDNIDLGCAVIEHVASEKAVELIDGEIGPSFAATRKQRETAGTAYYDAGTYSQGPFARVPEALRPKPGRLSVAQQRVYNDFVRNVWQNQSNQSSSVVTAGSPGLVGNSVNSSMTRVYGSSSSQQNSSIYTTSQVAPGFSSAQQLDLIQEDSDRGSTQLSVSSNTVGPNDGVIQSAVEISSMVPPVASPDIPTVETSAVSKDIGAVIQPSAVTPSAERMRSASAEPFLTTGDVLDKYQLLAQKLEALISKDAREAEIQGVIAEVPDIIARCVSRDEAGLAVAQKVFKSLYDIASSPILIVAHLAILSAIRDVCKPVVNELTNWVIHSDEDHKFNKEIVLGLIRSELLNLAEYNIHLTKLIDGGRNKVATEFAISLVQALVIHESGVNTSELYNVIDALAKLAMRPGSPESLQQLIEIVRNSTTNATSLAGFTPNKDEKLRQSRDKRVISGRIMTSRDEYNVNESAATDPAGLRDQVSHRFAEWCRICELPTTNDTTYSHYISQLQQSGLLNGDDITDRFFRILTELSVAHCLAHEQVNMPLSLSFVTIDAYAKLVVLVLKYFSMDQGSNKMFLLTKVLSVTVRVIHKDAEEKKTFFNPRPYFRLFINWLLDLTSDAVIDGSNFQVLTSFAVAFHALQPLKVPGFSFAWLELVSHRSFMPKLITSSTQKGWPCFQRLLVVLFKFMEPYLRSAELGEAVQLLYKGTMRVLLVLLHDFPEFLCEYHFSFCDVIPPSCIQMRNVILSAFPRNMRLPDPSTPNLKIDLLAEISQPPRILSDVDSALKAKQLKVDIDEYMKTKPEGSPFLSELKQRLLLPPSEAILAGTRYNAPLINSLVLYVGMQAIQQLQNKSTSPQQMTHNGHLDVFLVSAAMDIFQSLLINLDSEGRYLFLNAVANQLRYPNNHTHYFSFVLLFLFVEASQQEIFQEQITRVLLERLIVNRPHPWGLLITFIELIKNPRYNFWNRSFIRCAPEIEKLFESVSRSCGGPKAVDDGMVAGGIPDGNH